MIFGEGLERFNIWAPGGTAVPFPTPTGRNALLTCQNDESSIQHLTSVTAMRMAYDAVVWVEQVVMRLRIRPSGAPSPRKSVASSITAHLALRIPAPARNGTPTEDDGAGLMSMSAAAKKYRCGPLPPEAFGGFWHPHPYGMIRDHALSVTVPPDALICSARSVTSWIEFLNAP